MLQREVGKAAHERFFIVLGLVPAVAFFVVVYASALVHMGLYSLHAPDWSLVEFIQLARDTTLWHVLGYTFALAGTVTALAILIGYPVAMAMLDASPGVRRLLTVLLVVPLWTSTLVRSYAWMVVLGRQGVVNQLLLRADVISEPISLLYNRTAVIIGMVHVMLPYVVFPIYSVMRQIDLRLVKAARTLGAGPRTAFISVFLPLSLPGIFAGGVLVFVMSLGFWVTPTLLGGLRDTTYVMVIDNELNAMANWGTAAAMSMVLLVVTLLVLLLARRFVTFGGTAGSDTQQMRLLRFSRIVVAWIRVARRSIEFVRSTIGLPAPHARARRWSAMDQPRPTLSWIVTIAAIVYLIGPILVLFPLSLSAAPFMQFPPSAYSFRWFERYLTGADWLDPTYVSFRVATISMLISVPLGTLAALGIMRLRPRLKLALSAFVLSPLIVPPVVIAVGLYLEYGRFGMVGTITGLVFAHLILSVPFVIVVMLATLQSFDYSLEAAARSLGAGPLTALRRVVLPLIWPGVLTATFFAFLTSFDEVVLSTFLSGTDATTLPKRLLDAARSEFQPTIASVSVLLILLSFVVVSAIDIVQRGYARRRVAQPAQQALEPG